jgi:hypothetical protein
VRYQAALRPEPLGSNTRTIASQPTIVRVSLFFDDKFVRQPKQPIIKLSTWIFERELSSAFQQMRSSPRAHRLWSAPPPQSAHGNQQAALDQSNKHS